MPSHPTARARLAAVLGDPVAHSLSPLLHNHWFARLGIDGVYLALRVPAGDFDRALRLLPRLGFRGFNVTVPHKERAFRAVDRRDRAAETCGAVNTVRVEADGSLTGLNTDGFGFLAHLRRRVPGWRPDAGPAVVLGAGGAARAVVAALLEAGVGEMRIVNRTRARAEALVADLAPRFPTARLVAVDWTARDAALAGAALLVQTTSLGMRGMPPLELALDPLPPTAVVADVVYVPLETDLLRRARMRGHPVVDGLGMLIWQAVPGFRHWGGVEPPVDGTVEALLLEGLRATPAAE